MEEFYHRKPGNLYHRGHEMTALRTTLPSLASLGLLAACYPMEQAPLVYASKSTVGLSITAGTPENPGLDLIIGYKATDVALVPVAVAKYCRQASGSDCVNAIYEMKIITGSKLDTVDNGIIDNAIKEAKRSLQNRVDQSNTLAGSISTLEVEISKIEERKRLLQQLADLPDTDETENADLVATRTRLDAELAETGSTNIEDEDALQRQLANLAQKKRGVDIEMGEFQKQIADLSKRLQTGEMGERGDSFSVYGTFKGGGQGDSSGGALTGGKVFATGIAAQNLSETAAASDCLASIAFLASKLEGDDIAEERNALLSSASTVCAPNSN